MKPIDRIPLVRRTVIKTGSELIRDNRIDSLSNMVCLSSKVLSHIADTDKEFLQAHSLQRAINQMVDEWEGYVCNL